MENCSAHISKAYYFQKLLFEILKFIKIILLKQKYNGSFSRMFHFIKFLSNINHISSENECQNWYSI